MNYELNYPDIRDAVRRLCERFPSTYWQQTDTDQAYPAEFVSALTDAGYLGALIPEPYGGLGLPLSAAAAILEEIHFSGGNASACHAQMYTMGTVLRHGSEAQKTKYLPSVANGSLRLQAFGVTEPNSGSDTKSLQTKAHKVDNHFIVNGQKIWTSRAAHSDLLLLLARTTPVDQVKKKTDGLSVFLIDMRDMPEETLKINPIRTMMNHSTTELFFSDMPVPASSLIGEEGQGFKYILSGMNAERMLIAAECIRDAKWFIKQSFLIDPLVKTKVYSFQLQMLMHKCVPQN